MSSLFIDTSYKSLSIVVEEGGKLLASYSQECFKRQSEQLFVVLDKLFEENHINKSDIDALYITEGPGSYTGVRISLALAKVYCEIKGISLYTISTLKLYAGGKENTMVVMDARAKRAYVGVYDKGNCVLEDCAMELDKIDCKNYDVVLDGELVGKENKSVDIIECFMACKNDFEKVENINHLTPKYLKESDAYYR